MAYLSNSVSLKHSGTMPSASIVKSSLCAVLVKCHHFLHTLLGKIGLSYTGKIGLPYMGKISLPYMGKIGPPYTGTKVYMKTLQFTQFLKRWGGSGGKPGTHIAKFSHDPLHSPQQHGQGSGVFLDDRRQQLTPRFGTEVSGVVTDVGNLS